MIPTPKYAPNKSKEIRISHWKNDKANKTCKVVSNKMYTGDWSFEIHGYNPLPCKVFVGSFNILAKWLIDNGWEHDKSKADIIIIQQTV